MSTSAPASEPQYLWKTGAPRGYRDVPAAQAARTLCEIGERRGGVTSENVATDVEEEGPGHRLGPLFTFDVKEGMHKLHVIEAADVIRHIAVLAVVPEQQTPVRAFVIVRDDEGQRYEPTHIALRQPNKRAQVLADVRQEWAEFCHKMEEFLALCGALSQPPPPPQS
jgi:hypothetical protein